MKIRMGIMTVRDARYHPNQRLLEAIEAAGQQGVLIHPYRLWPEMRKGRLNVTAEENLFLPQVLLPRQGAQIGETSLALIRQLRAMGIVMINGPDGINIARNKFLTQQALISAGLPCLDTIFANSQKGVLHAVDRLGGFPVVVKSTRGRQGEGVALIRNAKDAHVRIPSVLNPREGLMIQRFLAPANRTDIRVLVVGSQCVAATELIPADGEFRANFHLGSDIRALPIAPELRQTAINAAKAVNCDVAGVDIMVDSHGRPAIVEVNYSPGFKGIESATGIDVAGHVVQFAINRFVESTK